MNPSRFALPMALTLIAATLPSTAEAGDPALRARVLANIQASKAARESSGYLTWARQAETGFAGLKRPAPPVRRMRSGPTDVPHNYVIKGGGGQASVLIDKGDGKLKRNIRAKAAKLRMNTTMQPWDKIERLQKVIRQKVSHAGNELDVSKNPNKYNKFNQKMTQRGGLAQLRDYLKMHKVVCREFAHITQVALEDAGFESRLVYGTVKKEGKVIGGHAWNEVKIDGRWQIVDTTNPQFNKVDPVEAGQKGTPNGWVWHKDSWGPRVVPLEQHRNGWL